MKTLKILGLFSLLWASSDALSTVSCVSELVSPNGKKIRIIGDSQFALFFTDHIKKQNEDLISHLENQNDYMVLTEDRMYEHIKGIKNKEDRSFYQNQFHNRFTKNITNRLLEKDIPARNVDFRDSRLYIKEIDILGISTHAPIIEYWNSETVNFHNAECRKIFDQIELNIPSSFKQEFQNLKSAYKDHIATFSSLPTNNTDEIHYWGFEYFRLEKAIFDFYLLGIIYTNDQAHDSPSITYLAVDLSHKLFLENTLAQIGYRQIYPVYAYTTEKISGNRNAFRERDPIDMKKTLENMSDMVATKSSIQAA